MPITITLPGPLQELAEGRGSLELAGEHASVADALGELNERWPAVYDRIVTEAGEVRQHVNLFVNEREIRRTGGLDTPLDGASEIFVLPSVSGG